jgi:DNA polymerase-3 subunit epsilon
MFTRCTINTAIDARIPVNILIVDTETTGLINTDPAPKLIEVAACLFHVGTMSELSMVQFLIHAESNPASGINGISEESLRAVNPQNPSIARVADANFGSVQAMWDASDYVLSHNSSFDRYFMDPVFGIKNPKEWKCSVKDIEFPKTKKSKSLSYLAVDHGIFPFGAHRALNDVLVLVALLKTVPNLAEQLCRVKEELLRFEARDLPFHLNPEAKSLGFKWDGKNKVWFKNMSESEAKSIPFGLTNTGKSIF